MEPKNGSPGDGRVVRGGKEISEGECNVSREVTEAVSSKGVGPRREREGEEVRDQISQVLFQSSWCSFTVSLLLFSSVSPLTCFDPYSITFCSVYLLSMSDTLFPINL